MLLEIRLECRRHNFVRGFESSEKVLVSLTRELTKDDACMNFLVTAFDSNKPLSKYIFVLFDDTQPISVPCHLWQLQMPDAPYVCLTRGVTIDDDQNSYDDFWRRLRNALMRDHDQNV